YFFDLDKVRLPHTSRRSAARGGKRAWSVPAEWRVTASTHSGLDRLNAEGRVGQPHGKNRGDVWRLPTAAYQGAHQAAFPIALAERPITAGCPERRCARCRAPWKRDTIRRLAHLAIRGELRPTCDCRSTSEPGMVLDPFIGSGTTALAAEQHGRNWLGI